MDSVKVDEKVQSPTDKTKSDPANMKLKKSMEEKRENKKDESVEAEEEFLDLERTPSGRVRRRSAQVAVFHLQEIAEDELAKDWATKRRIKDDLVPDIKRVRIEKAVLLYIYTYVSENHSQTCNSHREFYAFCKILDH